ncbi:hypothetical protein Poli38472_010827 [Pythium oligandrum]|uniref:Uncharacterized protein n=1 Tax=Pythium oligandrum TaxID=41045 RepID=A0A8K1CE49_PYTOL|nr:hypothetical protein Poli38472_010827 [Pythium oligandrum]|eukprot:TMW61764.1 hypothetical protein Poli38472_010827 [Pythium oligandrum]
MSAVVAEAVNDAVLMDENSFGDLLAELLRTLPADASKLFLRSLSGLSPSESHDFCDYVSKLKPEKQFRVIQAMSDATVDGKRKFLTTLAKKIEEQQRKQQELQEEADKDLEAHVKRKEALQAKERVKALNPAANKFHSFNAALGAGVSVTKENVASNVNTSSPTAKDSPSSPGPESVSRSLSSSSLIITKEDIKQVGALLGSARITESEMNLRELEISRKAFQAMKSNGDESVEMTDAAKRDRPESSRELIKQEQKPLQRTRSDDNDNGYDYNNSSNDGSESPSADSVDQSEDPEAPSTKRWTKLQDNALRESVRIHGEKNWKAIAELVPGRNHAQCLQRWRKVLKPGLVKGHWSFEEDQILEYLVTQGCNNWGQIAERIPGRTPKQCRERWKNHLDPAINKGPYTEEEDRLILDAQSRLGNKWSQIAQLLKGRTEDSVKIRWKSLKQNPAKAAASHAQHKKAQQQQQPSHTHQQVQAQAAALAYQQNPALLRQRQMQLLQQQQQLQHSEAAQLEHQQQLQQQQLQLRLQERMMHRQVQPHPSMMGNGIDLNGALKPDPSLDVNQAYGHAGFGSGSYDFTNMHAASGMSTPSSASYNYVSPGMGIGIHHHSNNSPLHSDDARDSTDNWDLHGDLGDGFTRLGENPPPATFWDNYPKHPGADLIPEPIPLHAQVPHHDASSSFGVPEDDVYDDAMFEKLATELGSNSIHFAPI